MYFKNFWKVLPDLFTLDFWRVNPKLKKLAQNIGYDCLSEAEIWAAHKGYDWCYTWYLDGEKFLLKKEICICMYSPYEEKFTRIYAHQPDYKENYNYNDTFMLNHNKSARFFFEHFVIPESKKTNHIK